MRKIIFVALALVCLYATSFAQSKTPTAVITAFNQKFPNASKVKWDKENDKEYEAGFQWKGIKHSANFSNNGEWLETESPTTFAKLPMKVQNSFNANHKNSRVTAVAQIETSTGKTKFEIEFMQGAKTVEVFYDENGNEIKM